MRYISQDIAAAGDTTVIDVSSLGDYSPTKAVRIYGLTVQNTTGTSQTIEIKGPNRLFALNSESISSGIDKQFVPLVLPPDTDLVLNASTADSFILNIMYTYL